MATPSPPASQQGVARDHRFHPVRVRRVVPETAEAASLVLDVPADLRATFAYEAGQFLTFRVRIDGETHHRCYSLSSSPVVDDDLQVTIKRVPGGLVSNWLLDTVRPGDPVEVTAPSGVFCLVPGDRDLVACSAGSGITPVLSLVKTALATTGRRVRLLYANRDRDAVIFAGELAALAERHPDRLAVTHHLDVERGFVDAATLAPFLDGPVDADHYVCGPTPFMDIVEGALRARGVAGDRIHIERFTPAAPGDAGDAVAAAPPGADGPARVTVELGGRTDTVEHHPGTTVLQTARQMGMAPPFSCESGSCATCMALVVEGTCAMHVNNALTDDEVAEGWVLTCQAVPTSAAVHVVYEGS